MPAAIPLIVSVAGTAAGWAATTVAIWTVATSVVVGLYERDRAQSKARKARDAYLRSIEDRLITVRSAVKERSYVLGTVRVGGTLMYSDSLKPDKSALDSVIALACNECQLVGYYINDEFVTPEDFPGEKFGKKLTVPTFEAHVVAGSTGTVYLKEAPNAGLKATYWNGSKTIEVIATLGENNAVSLSGLPAGGATVTISYSYSSGTNLRVQFKDGAPDQVSTEWTETSWSTVGHIGGPGIPVTTTIESPLWTENHRLRGVAHIRSLMLWDQDIYSTGAPNMGAVVKGGWIDGHPFYDPRDGSNPVYTDNPAILAAWWWTLPRNRGGWGVPSSWINWASVATAANICDELITVKNLDGDGYTTIKRYQCHTVLSMADAPADNLDVILSSMAGSYAFTAGEYRLWAGAFRTATLTITDKDVIGTKSITVSAVGGANDPPNVVTARFADATQNYAETSPKPVINAAYVTLDGRESPLDVSLSATTDPRQANYLMGVALEMNRPAYTVTLTVGGIGENIALGDTVQISLSGRPQYAGRTLEVRTIKDNGNGEFDLTMREIRTQTWALNPDSFTPSSPVPIPDLSYLWNVAALTGLTVELGTPQTLPDGNSITSVQISWDEPPQQYVREGGRIEIRYRESGGDWISVAPLPGGARGTTISASLIDGGLYQFQARAVNGVGAAGTWATQWASIEGTVLAAGVQGSGVFTWAGPVGVTTTPNSIKKTGAGGAWNAGAYSLQSYSLGCYANARPGEATTNKVFGLNDDPAVNNDFTGINYAWRATAAGQLEIIENGILVSNQGSYTANTTLSITYDSVNVRYLKDGVVVRTVAVTGLRLFLDISLFTTGASWEDVAFGPMGSAGTPGLPGASAQSVRIVASAYVLTFDSAGNPSPAGQSITLTAARLNIATPVAFTTTPTVTLTGSGDVRTLTAANFGSNQSVNVRVEAAGFFDEVTIVRLSQGATGASAIQGILTNPSHTLAADPDGVVGSFNGANGQFLVYQGTIDRTSNATFSVASASNCTVEINTAVNTPVAGQPKGFYRVTAVTDDQAYAVLQAVYGDVTVPLRFTITRARQGAPGEGANLLRVDEWTVGTTGAQGTHWQINGTAAESAIVLGGAGTAPMGPLGITEPLWECRPSGDANADGGWNYPLIPIDHQKSYRSTCWFRVNQISGSAYLGCDTATTNNLGGGANTNPYFFGTTLASLGLEANQWYLGVGIIHGSGYGGGYSGFAGIYDPRTGKRIYQGVEYRNIVGAATQRHRAYHFYDSSTTTRQWMARPRFEEINGNEPSIWDLMGIRLPTPWIERGDCVAFQNSFHKIGGTSAWDSDIYSIQSFTNCHLQIRPGQTTAGIMVGLNSDPVTSSGYVSIDYAWYCTTGGALQIYESGVLVAGSGGQLGTYTTSTELAITYDGTSVRYYKDRILVRTVAISGARFYLDSSFNTPGGMCSVKFGPGTMLETIGTGEIEPGAATDPIQQSFNAAEDVLPSQIGAPYQHVVQSINFIPTASGEVKVTAAFDMAIAGLGSSGTASKVFLAVAHYSGSPVTQDSKVIPYIQPGSTWGDLPALTQACAMSIVMQVVGGQTYTAEIRSETYPSTTKPGWGARVSNRFLRVEVNKR